MKRPAIAANSSIDFLVSEQPKLPAAHAVSGTERRFLEPGNFRQKMF